MKYYSALKKMKFCHLQHKKNLQGIMLSKVSQKKTNTACFPLYMEYKT